MPELRKLVPAYALFLMRGKIGMIVATVLPGAAIVDHRKAVMNYRTPKKAILPLGNKMMDEKGD